MTFNFVLFGFFLVVPSCVIFGALFLKFLANKINKAEAVLLVIFMLLAAIGAGFAGSW